MPALTQGQMVQPQTSGAFMSPMLANQIPMDSQFASPVNAAQAQNNGIYYNEDRRNSMQQMKSLAMARSSLRMNTLAAAGHSQMGKQLSMASHKNTSDNFWADLQENPPRNTTVKPGGYAASYADSHDGRSRYPQPQYKRVKQKRTRSLLQSGKDQPVRAKRRHSRKSKAAEEEPPRWR